MRRSFGALLVLLLSGCGTSNRSEPAADPGDLPAAQGDREFAARPEQVSVLATASAERAADAPQSPSEPSADADPVGSLEKLGAKFTRKGLVVVSVNLSNSQITDADLAHVSRLSQLEQLYLFNTSIGDAALAHLKGLTHLNELSLARTKITDKGLSELADLTGLETLDLSLCMQIKGAGLKHLKAMTALKELLLYQTQVTDDSLDHLRQMTHLEYIVLPDITVSAVGLAALQKALPKCEIIKQDY
ncbi:MAG: hypothetical protein CMJ59_14345 [Planctomycetaceae bacterium]|nr:hypothetical protein [Planctomycetaceae bacterium]